MKKMQENEFDKLKFDIAPDKCVHAEVVKLYVFGAHTDYGCLSCGLTSSNVEIFKR